MMEHDMSMLMDWFKANQLSLNVEKTIMIKFWSNNTPFEVNIEKLTIKNSKSTKFLGVIIDDNLTWNDHVNAFYNKLLSNKRLLQNAKKLPLNVTLKHIYYAHIHSHLIYGLSIWGSMIMKKMKKILHQIQTTCLKFMSNKKQDYPQSGIYTQHAILPFPMLIKQELIKLGYKLSSNHLPTPLKHL